MVPAPCYASNVGTNGMALSAFTVFGDSRVMNKHAQSYLVQWSENEHQFHIEQAGSILESTVKDFLSGGTPEGYVTLAIVDSYEEADSGRARLRKSAGSCGTRKSCAGWTRRRNEKRLAS